MSGLRSFSAPTRIVAGLGALERLAEELAGLGAGTVAVVCDEGVANAGLLDEAIVQVLQNAMSSVRSGELRAEYGPHGGTSGRA